MTTPSPSPSLGSAPQQAEQIALSDLWKPLASNWRSLIAYPLGAGLLAFGITFLIKPTFTSRTLFLPPQQQQSAATAALSSLGALSSLAGSAAGLKSPADQYVSLMQSTSAQDAIIDKFSLMQVYDKEYRFQARGELEKNVRILIGKKDGLITVEADATDPKLAADIANEHVTELRKLTSTLALTEAKQRRIFFEGQLERTKTALTQAQKVLQASGFNGNALNAEPKAAAEAYGRLRAQAAAIEVRIEGLRKGLSDSAPEMQALNAQLGALRQQIKSSDRNNESSGDTDYVRNYREYKYQETLFELFSKQYELARLDEAKEGSLIQVIDLAVPAEIKSHPRRGRIAAATTLVTLLLLSLTVIFRARSRSTASGATPA